MPSLVVGEGAVPWIAWHDFTSTPQSVWCSAAGREGAPCEGLPLGPAWTPRAVSDSAGITHLAWRGRNGSQDEIFHASRDGESWSAAVNVSRTAGSSRNPALAVDPWGRPHLLWEEDSGDGRGVRFFEAHFEPRSGFHGWTVARDAGIPFAAAGFLDTVRLACDAAGTLHATWQDGDTAETDVFHAQRPVGGVWSPPRNVSNTPGAYSVEPSIAVAVDGTLQAAWVEQDDSSGGFAEICTASRDPAGHWSPLRELTQLRTGAFHPVIAVADDDLVRVAFASGPAGAREVLLLTPRSREPVNISRSPGADSDRAALALVPWAGIAWQEGSPPHPEIFLAEPEKMSRP